MSGLTQDAAVLMALRRLEAANPGRSGSVAEIARVAGIPPLSARSSLILLTLRGTVEKVPGGRFTLHRPDRQGYRGQFG